MVFVRECQPRLEELFYPTEEKRVERFLALSLSNSNQKLPLMSVYIPVSFLGYFISDQKIVGLRYRSRKSFLGLRSKEIK